jgi:hypothetical protein
MLSSFAKEPQLLMSSTHPEITHPPSHPQVNLSNLPGPSPLPYPPPWRPPSRMMPGECRFGAMIVPLNYALNCGWIPLFVTGAVYHARGGPDGLNYIAMIVCACLWFLLLLHSFESSDNGPDPPHCLASPPLRPFARPIFLHQPSSRVLGRRSHLIIIIKLKQIIYEMINKEL